MRYDMEVLVLTAEHMILRILQILNMEEEQVVGGWAEIRAIMGRPLLPSLVTQIPLGIHRPTRAIIRDNIVRVGIRSEMSWIMGGMRMGAGSISRITMIIDEKRGMGVVRMCEKRAR